MSDPPTISVIIATFNRSRALAAAIESVRRQSFTDWELIVVGDACTDDSAVVVASFGDPRMSFVNLARNTGEQAGPHNVGIARARGELIAFLNHDDVWLPHHLLLCREQLLATRADLVFATAAAIGGDAALPLRFETFDVALVGLCLGIGYDPAELDFGVVPASLWLTRREMLECVDGWRSANECVVEPSQDLLFRAWRRGFRLRALNDVTLVRVARGHLHGAYAENVAPVQEWVLDRLEEPWFAAELAARALETNAKFNDRVRSRPPRVRRLAARILARGGINPRAVTFRLRGFRRGDYVPSLRAGRGLPLQPARRAGPALRAEIVRRSCRVDLDELVSFRAGAGGARLLASGWSRPDDVGVWNDGTTAELLFDLGHPLSSDLQLDLTLEPFTADGRVRPKVEFKAGGRSLAVWDLGNSSEPTRRLVVPRTVAQGPRVLLEFAFTGARSPRSLRLSDDPRLLAVRLHSVLLTSVDRARIDCTGSASSRS